MGKKLPISKSSSRICKNEKKQFNSLVNVLRPKVYITDVLNFKNLVQELTGNNFASASSNLITSTTSSSPYLRSQVPNSISKIHENRDSNSSRILFETLIDSSNFWDTDVILNDRINRSWNDIYEDVTAIESSRKQQMEFPTIEEMEMWLLDMEPYWLEDGVPRIEEEINMY